MLQSDIVHYNFQKLFLIEANMQSRLDHQYNIGLEEYSLDKLVVIQHSD